MNGGSWATQREKRQHSQDAKESARRLKIEFADRLWLANNHPVDDSVLGWLAENRSEASRIGSSRWNLETLPELVAIQNKLRVAERFQEILNRAAISHQTITTEQVLQAGGFSTIPHIKVVENIKPQNPALQRPRRSDAGLARKPLSDPTPLPPLTT